MDTDIVVRLGALRERMREEEVDVYYIPTNDFHSSEYVGEYFKCRKFISGFTGSAGTVVVTMEEAGLWTDGRYFLQAEAQLKGTGITLYKSGMEGVPSIKEFIMEHVSVDETLGFDGRTVPAAWAEDMKDSLECIGAHIYCECDLVGDIWDNRPELKSKPVMLLEDCYSGCSRDEKISCLRNRMKYSAADYFVLTALDDIAWLLNMRGDDIHCCPVVLSYIVVNHDDVLLFADRDAFSDEVAQTLERAGIVFKDYGDIYDYVRNFESGSRVMIDKSIANYAIVSNIGTNVRILDEVNPTMKWKAVKNPVEVANEEAAHIKDGVAVTKFIYWIKHNIGKIPMTEMSVSDKLEEIRSKGEHYIGPSFDTIAGYAEHGAIVHYSATLETDAELREDNFILVDTGGHYLEGTTDITRTILLGCEATEEQKKFYTAVLRGNLNLCNAHFIYGCSGVALDYIARKPLWDMGCDYNHGTGHGVGYLLNVHESPNAFRYRIISAKGQNGVLESGMITSDEPGIYITGKFGIRLENLILCEKREHTEYGQFMGFRPLTFVPFDRKAIDRAQMNSEEIELLDRYHEQVYAKISPYLEDDEKVWLEQQCRPL